MEWPLWLRRRTGVEHLGPPDRFFAWTTIGLCLLVLVYVGAWNAMKYPVPLGYDAQPNAAYAHVLLDDHRIPHADESGESNQPPLYYLIGGVAGRFGLHWPFNWREGRAYPGFPEASYRGAQYLNILFVVLTALCLIWLARIVAPGRPWVWASTLGYFAFLPVVAKTEAMFHPEPLNMLLATAAIAAVTSMLARRAFSKGMLLLLALALGLGLLTRAAAIFTLAAVCVGVAIAMTKADIRRAAPLRRIAIVVSAALLLVMPLIAYKAVVHHQGPLNESSRILHAALHPRGHALSDFLTTHDHFFVIWEPGVFDHPWRSHYVNEAFPQTYTEIWGDWLASFAWSAYDGTPSPAAQSVLKDQSYIGFLPTALAIAGWLAVVWLAARRRRELAVLAVMPIFAVGGYLYRSYVTLTHDGDLLKASYALNSTAVWAIGFGIATAWLANRSRLARYGMIALFAAFAVLEMRFLLYGVRDGRPIF